MTPKTPSTEHTDEVEEILNSLHSRILGTHASNDRCVKETKQALDQHYLKVFLEIVGEDEDLPNSIMPKHGQVMRNRLKDELRQAAKERLGGKG